MAEAQNDPFDALSYEEKQQLVDLAQSDIDAVAQATGLSRRQVMQAGIALLVGTVGGGLTAAEFIQRVEAAASTSDSDGNVGLPGDRVDIFADGVDSNSVSTNDGTINGDPIMGMPSSSSSAGLSFGSWTEINANQPTELLLRITVETDGSSDGLVFVDVDESGGTTADYTLAVQAVKETGSGVTDVESFNLNLPEGAQVRVRNSTDPNGGNSIQTDRVWVMSS